MKLRNAALLLSLAFIAELIYFVINKGALSLMDEPFSALGNIEGNYAVFLFGTGVLFILFGLLLHKMYKKAGVKTGIELYGFVACGIVTLLVPYNREVMLSRAIHTALGIVSSIIVLFIFLKFNRYNSPKNCWVKKFLDISPWVMLGGTLVLFLIIGLNSFMELFYSVFLVAWVNIAAFSLESTRKRNRS